MAKVVSRAVLALFMVSMGALHFFAADLFVQLVPPFLPSPLLLVWISGVFELALGAGLLFPKTRRAAGLGLALLFVAVFPANLYMTFANVQVHGLPSWISQPSPLALWLRLPFQFVFIGWALWVSTERTGFKDAEAHGAARMR